MADDRSEREKEAGLRDYFARMKRSGIGSKVIESEREIYEHERNILTAWLAYLVARKTGEAIPDWVLEALDEVGTRLFSLYLSSTDGRKISNADIAKAVKLSGSQGRGNAFTQYGSSQWWTMADLVGVYMGQGDPETYAIAAVATEFNANISTVRRAWLRYQKAMPERVAKILSFTKPPLS